MWTDIYLQWYRDKGRGQEAADANPNAEQLVDIWPVARIRGTNDELLVKWKELLDTFEVNATTYYIG